MRWIVSMLVFLNGAFLIWNWLEYSHARNLDAMNAAAASDELAMPGFRLVMVRERQESGGGTGNDVAAQAAVPQQQGQAAAPAVALCTLLGPLPEREKGRQLIDRLASLQIVAEYSAVDVAGEPEYWVYLGVEPTRDLATSKLRELQEKKIDSFIIPQGELENAISLGVFDKKENAELRRQEMVGLGYEPRIYENTRNYVENWVVLRPGQSEKMGVDLYAQIREEMSGLDMRREICDKVAPLGDIH